MDILSVIIPVYNEERYVGELLRRVLAVNLEQYGIIKEVIVVDDGSTDNTVEEINKFRDREEIKIFAYSDPNHGKGNAIITGLKHSTGKVIMIQDADLEYNPEEYYKVVSPIFNGNADVVYGSRVMGNKFRKHKNAYLGAYLGGILLTKLTNLLYGSHLTDINTCYKAFKASVIKEVDLESSGFGFDQEVTARLLRKGYVIEEVPIISYQPRSYAEGKKVNLHTGLNGIYVLIKWRIIL